VGIEEMIGQHNLQSRIEQLIENGTFPRFSILVGPKGSGKKILAHEIEHMFNAWRVYSDFIDVYRLPDVKIDTIRDMIAQSYKQVRTMVYIIPDADNMSPAAKNAILKVTEEPPNEAYFIMTLEDENNTLETIRSRGTVFHMDRYTPDEIEQYLTRRYGILDNRELSIVRGICETPGDVDIITDEGIIAFHDYVELVVDNIAEVSLANAFKIPSKVALKDDAEGYDLRLFWKSFMNVCLEKADNHIDPEDISRYGEACLITSKYLQKLKVKGINKQMLIDNWVLEIRELWN
jgi:DNA polymerase III delta prime subunit